MVDGLQLDILLDGDERSKKKSYIVDKVIDDADAEHVICQA